MNPENEINFVNPTSVRNFLTHAVKNVSNFSNYLPLRAWIWILNKKKKKTTSIHNMFFVNKHF
jgi:hypothetical protein